MSQKLSKRLSQTSNRNCVDVIYFACYTDVDMTRGRIILTASLSTSPPHRKAPHLCIPRSGILLKRMGLGAITNQNGW